MSLTDLDGRTPPPAYRGPDVFPHYYMMFSTTGGQVDSSGGLSLRDLLAAVALHGLVNSATATIHPAHYAVTAYDLADKMLTARELPRDVPTGAGRP